jgi:hypothetical protein
MQNLLNRLTSSIPRELLRTKSIRPSSSAAAARFALSCIVRNTNLALGTCSVILRAASKPFKSGIVKSVTITSVLSLMASCTMTRPSAQRCSRQASGISLVVRKSSGA